SWITRPLTCGGEAKSPSSTTASPLASGTLSPGATTVRATTPRSAAAARNSGVGDFSRRQFTGVPVRSSSDFASFQGQRTGTQSPGFGAAHSKGAKHRSVAGSSRMLLDYRRRLACASPGSARTQQMVQIIRSADQPQVSQRLGVVPQQLATGADLLRVEPQVVRVAQQL